MCFQVVSNRNVYHNYTYEHLSSCKMQFCNETMKVSTQVYILLNGINTTENDIIAILYPQSGTIYIIMFIYVYTDDIST